jgi:hypothetical protein
MAPEGLNPGPEARNRMLRAGGRLPQEMNERYVIPYGIRNYVHPKKNDLQNGLQNPQITAP